MIIEDLERDAYGNVSSQPTIKAGKNRGWREKLAAVMGNELDKVENDVV